MCVVCEKRKGELWNGRKRLCVFCLFALKRHRQTAQDTKSFARKRTDLTFLSPTRRQLLLSQHKRTRSRCFHQRFTCVWASVRQVPVPCFSNRTLTATCVLELSRLPLDSRTELIQATSKKDSVLMRTVELWQRWFLSPWRCGCSFSESVFGKPVSNVRVTR